MILLSFGRTHCRKTSPIPPGDPVNCNCASYEGGDVTTIFCPHDDSSYSGTVQGIPLLLQAGGLLLVREPVMRSMIDGYGTPQTLAILVVTSSSCARLVNPIVKPSRISSRTACSIAMSSWLAKRPSPKIFMPITPLPASFI